jgi:acid phosphatase
MRKVAGIAYLLLAWRLAAQPAPGPVTDPGLNAVAWVQTAAEYAALTTQTYRAAGLALSAALADPNWTAAYEQTNDFRSLPPAVILDLDETVLDNSSSQAILVRSGKTYSEQHWDAWVKQARAGAIPGAVEFLHAAVLRGVAPVYVTNRVCNPADALDPTVKVLRQLRIPLSPDRLLCKTSGSDKSDRRRAVAERFRILLLIGDDFGDFTTPPTTPAARAELQRFHDPMWGVRWFVLPNPMYGSWERAVGLDARAKRDALRP